MKAKYDKVTQTVTVELDGYCGTDDFVDPYARFTATKSDVEKMIDLMVEVSNETSNELLSLKCESVLVTWVDQDGEEIENFDYSVCTVYHNIIKFTAQNKYSDYYLSTEYITRKELMEILEKFK